MISFYFHPTPNPLKVALFLEESGIAHEIVPVDTRKVGADIKFKQEMDEEAKRAMFSSNYPLATA